MSDTDPPTTPAAGFSSDPREARAQAKASKAHAKALRPWFKKKRVIIPLALIALIGISVAASGGGEEDQSTTVADDQSTTEAEPEGSGSEAVSEVLFPGRPDAQKEDQERNIGGSVQLSGYTTTVRSAGYQQKLSDFEEDGYVVAEVTIENRDDEAQAYNLFDWKLQTPNGQVISPTFTSGDTLGSGDLVSGGKVSGKVVFEAGQTKGDFFIVYKPDPFDAARGIWKVTV